MVESVHDYTPYSIASERAIRLQPQGSCPGSSDSPPTTLRDLYDYLYQGDPAVITHMKQTCGATFGISADQGPNRNPDNNPNSYSETRKGPTK